MESGPYFLCCRFTSSAMRVVASSQEILLYLLLPRFCGFLSPFGSQSTLFKGYLIRLGEYTLFLYAKEKGGGVAFISGSKDLPFFVIFQGLNCLGLYFQSKCNGLILIIFPLLISIAQGTAPNIPPLRPSALITVLSAPFRLFCRASVPRLPLVSGFFL